MSRLGALKRAAPDESRAEPVATANGAKPPWLISNVRQKKHRDRYFVSEKDRPRWLRSATRHFRCSYRARVARNREGGRSSIRSLVVGARQLIRSFDLLVFRNSAPSMQR